MTISAGSSVGGASFKEAAINGGVELTGPFADRLFKVGPVQKLFDKVAVPILITYGGQNAASTVLSKFTQAVGTEKGKQLLLGSPPKHDEEAHARRSPLIAETTLTNRLLLYLGFVNMDNGIGRGW